MKEEECYEKKERKKKEKGHEQLLHTFFFTPLLREKHK